MNKDKLLKLIAQKEAIKQELSAKANVSQDVAELRSINADIDLINADVKELRSMIDAIENEETARTSAEVTTGAEQRWQSLNPIATYGIGTGSIATEKRAIDIALEMPTSTETEKAEMRTALFATPEYRTGYLKSLAGRTNLSDIEKRALSTATGSGGAAVPTTTYDMIIKRMTQTSALFGIIKKSYIPGNVVLPVANAQTAAAWTDTYVSDADDTLTQVALGSYALSKFAKVKGQLLIMAIDAFEAYVVSAIADQLAIAVENIILNGTGSSQPTGILGGGVTFDTTNSATWTKGSTVGYDDLVGAKALLGLYRSNAVWVMNANMEAQIYKVKTTVNQPLFTQNPITGLISNPLGFPIVVDYYMPDNTILLFNPDYYYMNINQNPLITSDDSAGFLSTSRLYRGTMFMDSKPALSAAFVKLTQATA